MADQDFNITVRTIADTTGIKLTEQGLNAIKIAALQGNQQAIASLRQLTQAAKDAKSEMSFGGVGAGLGVGTIVSLLTGAIVKWKQFNDEQDKIIDKMFEATAKMREEALAVAKIKDLDFSEELNKQAKSVEELEGNFSRLTQKIATLKAEQDALDPLTQSKEWKELRTEINAYESQLKSVQSTLQQKGVTDFTPKIPGPKAGVGESQALVDEIERNRKAAEENLKEDIWEFDPETGGYKRTGQKRFPLFQPPPQPPPPSATNPVATADQYKSPIGPPIEKGGLNTLAADVIAEAVKKAVESAVDKYWGR